MFAPEPPRDSVFHPDLREFPFEEDVYMLDELGRGTAKINLNRLEPSQYWDSKQKWIGLVIIVCVGFLVVTLLGETKVIEGAWTQIVNFLGQFMPKMPELPKLW